MSQIRDDLPLRDDLQPQSQFPRPNAPRPPRRRRRVNLARAGVAVAGIALLVLGGFALSAYQAWQKPMPLRHKTVVTTSALPIPAGTREVVGLPGHSDPSHISLQTDTVYAGAPVEISAMTDMPLDLRLPATASVVGPAGPTISFGGVGSTFAWHATVPATAMPSVSPASGSMTYASWYIEFSKPGRYQIPVSIGASTATATVTVIAPPPGGKVTAHMTPPNTLRPLVTVQNLGSGPVSVIATGLPSTLAPGATSSVTPGASWQITLPLNGAGANLSINTYQSHGHVTYGGSITRHHTVAYRPHRPPFALPLWLLLALVLAALLLVASLVAGMFGGRGTLGRGPKDTGTAGK